MEPVRLGIVGCGGMGRRHLAALGELDRAGDRSINLVAVCDLNEQNAQDLADEAHQMLDKRPTVFTDLAKMAGEIDGLEAADCTTDTGIHHKVASDLLNLGLHTMVEKPLGITIRGCNLVIEAAERNGKVLSVAENYRRDPINRLVRALLDDGAIGNRQFIMETNVHGRDNLIITPWRHLKLKGVITLDAGVHNADILLYYFGDPTSAFGQTRLFHKTRVRRGTAGPGGFYEKWADKLPPTVEATGEDAIFGMITFANGALGQWVDHHAGHGEGYRHRMVFGTTGSIAVPEDRSGKVIRLVLDDGTVVSDERVLDYAPSYQLNALETKLFERERPWTYNFDFPTTDRKLIALEYAEFANSIRTGTPPEIDGATGKRAVAIVYALFESQVAGRPVTIEEIESSAVDSYQREIDEHYELV